MAGLKAVHSGIQDIHELQKTLAAASTKDSVIRDILHYFKEHVSLLESSKESVVGVILRINWLSKPREIQEIFYSLICNLVSAYPNYLRAALRSLIKVFLLESGFTKEELSNSNSLVDPPAKFRDLASQRFGKVHCLLRNLQKIVPMSNPVLLQLLRELKPFKKKAPFIHESYLDTLLSMAEYTANLRIDLMELALDMVIEQDLLVSREELTEDHSDSEDENDGMAAGMDMESKDRSSSPENTHKYKLDLLMNKLLFFIHKSCHSPSKDGCHEELLNWAETKTLYRELLQLFDRKILTTQHCNHIQFLMFKICSYNLKLSEGFLDYLWKKVRTPETHSVYRIMAVSYMASYVSRAAYIGYSMVKAVLDLLVLWAHSYVDETALTLSPADVMHHAPFYAVCQAIFYIFIFRHKDLLDMPNGPKYCMKLNLHKLVCCRLNPLRVCLSRIVHTFASISRQHQLAYCDVVIERNLRNNLPMVSASGEECGASASLESYFPFDPYLLPVSSAHFKGLYQEFTGRIVDVRDELEDEEDGFIEEDSLSSHEQSMSHSFGQSPPDIPMSSPGFGIVPWPNLHVP